MTVRMLSRAIFALMLLLLAVCPCPMQAQGPTQASGPAYTLDSAALLAAHAPWLKIEVNTAGNIGQHVSVAIHPDDGSAYISYYHPYNKALYMAHYLGHGGNCGPDNTWYCQTIDYDGDVGQHNSIAVRSSYVLISYFDRNERALKLARSIDHPAHQEWTISTIDQEFSPATTGLYTSLDYTNLAKITYYRENPEGEDALRVATYVGGHGNCGYGNEAGRWRCNTIDTGEGVGQYSSLAVDDAGKLHVAYHDAANGDLWYATNTSGANCGPGGNSWTCYPVAVANQVGKYASIYVDDADKFHIAYYDGTAEELKYAVNVGSGGNCGIFSSAQCDTIDAMPADYHPLGISIVEDMAGYPIIAYQSDEGALNVARPLAGRGLPGGAGNCGPVDLFYEWRCDLVHRYGRYLTFRNADYAAIAVNSAGLATIAYYGFITAGDGDLLVAHQRLQTRLPMMMK